MPVRLLPLLLLPILLSPAQADEPADPLKRRAFFGAALAPGQDGVAVREVFPGSSAADAGLKPGDVIASAGGEKLDAPGPFVARLAKIEPGGTIEVEVVRDGNADKKTVTLKERPRETSDEYDILYGSVKARGGLQRTIITRPKGEGRRPAVLLIQGLGSFSVDNPAGGPDFYSTLIRDLTLHGYVTMRVDKPGCGDSQGGPARDVDFDTELDNYRQSLLQLKATDYVDPDNLFIFGHSMGGIMGPLLAAEIPLKGVAGYGTVVRTWYEYSLENTRRQLDLAGTDYSDIDGKIRTLSAFDQYLLAQKLDPKAIAAKSADLAEMVGESIADGQYLFGRHVDFFRQLAAKDLPAAWQKHAGYALAVWGEADFVTSPVDHELIARIVNREHPGHGTYVALAGSDHGFSRARSQADSFARHGQPGEFNPAILETFRQWLDRTVQESAKKP